MLAVPPMYLACTHAQAFPFKDIETARARAARDTVVNNEVDFANRALAFSHVADPASNVAPLR